MALVYELLNCSTGQNMFHFQVAIRCVRRRVFATDRHGIGKFRDISFDLCERSIEHW